MQKIFIGADHNGFALKKKIKVWLDKKGLAQEDMGNIFYDASDDYPDYALRVARRVSKDKARGVLVCGSSHGMAIAANKIKGIRAVAVNNMQDARKTREDDDANVICLSGWQLSFSQAVKILGVWLSTPFSGEARHKRRLAKITRMEKPWNALFLR
ncbi:MAG: RpiB/LacA/LacB family sugar-phosphate isomerase [Candidatus Aenigmarchaeota archaeon]|nr:RpiB/LacA/LacB family sugar-phosphate isomerase [Candidatus Aenigmarchaeota archaeon]